MSETIQRPRVCRNAHCGAGCCPIQAEDMLRICNNNPYKCYYYERRDDLYQHTEIQDKVNQAKKEISNKVLKYSGSGNEVTQAYCDGFKDSLKILNNLIKESEDG